MQARFRPPKRIDYFGYRGRFLLERRAIKSGSTGGIDVNNGRDLLRR
jgi:hypothetical protein